MPGAACECESSSPVAVAPASGDHRSGFFFFFFLQWCFYKTDRNGHCARKSGRERERTVLIHLQPFLPATVNSAGLTGEQFCLPVAGYSAPVCGIIWHELPHRYQQFKCINLEKKCPKTHIHTFRRVLIQTHPDTQRR